MGWLRIWLISLSNFGFNFQFKNDCKVTIELVDTETEEEEETKPAEEKWNQHDDTPVY